MADSKYEVIVVGGGPGGSACAALLAKWGMKTLLVEKNDRVGGKALNMTKEGFTYELWPIIGLPRYNSQFEAVLKEVGAEAPMSDVMPTVGKLSSPTIKDGGLLYRLPSGEYTGFNLVPPLMIPEILTQEALKEVNRLFDDMASFTPEQLDALDDVNLHDFLSRYEIPQSVYSYLALLSNILLVVQIDLCSASEMVKTMRQYTTGLGTAYFMGGYAKLSEALVEALKRHGGEVCLRTRVERINVEHGQVRGVFTNKGVFEAPIVVSNTGIQPTVLKLVGEEHFDKSYVNYIRELIPSMGLMGSRYLLNKQVFEDCAYIIFSDNNWWNMERYLRAKAGQIPDDMIIIIFNPSGFDPSLVPEGKQLVLTATLCPADPKMKNMRQWLDALDEKVAEFRPEIRKHTILREDYTTADVSRVTRDSVAPGLGGECIGLGQVVGQCGRHKPSPKAPIQGLFYVGVDAGGYGVGTHQAVDSAAKVAPMVLRYYQTHY